MNVHPTLRRGLDLDGLEFVAPEPCSVLLLGAGLVDFGLALASRQRPHA